jgi:dUTP pyrophosphatase
MHSNEVKIFVEICRKGIALPEYARHGDAGMDILAAEDVVIGPGETVIIPTGLKVAIPDGYELQVRPRSGISYKTPLRVSNSPGTIDSGYRDEVGIIMTNTSTKKDTDDLLPISSIGNINGTYSIKKGDRVAQITLQVVPKIVFELIDSVKDIGVDRGGGFGSTGTN